MSLSWRKVAAGVVGLGLLFSSVAACSSSRSGSTATTAGSATMVPSDTLVGIAMPTKSLERWNRDGAHLEDLLKKDGFKTSLQYADNKVDQQITQLQNMINQGAKILVIASIDGTALGPVLQTPKTKSDLELAKKGLINYLI